MDSMDLKCLPDWFSIVNWGRIQGLWWGLRGGGLCPLLTASHCSCPEQIWAHRHLHEHPGSFSSYFHEVDPHRNFGLQFQGGPFGAHPDLLDQVQGPPAMQGEARLRETKGPEGQG